MSAVTLPHVVVVGGGLAGLSAAAEALTAGVRVTLIDKQKLGGNSAKATSGINAVLTKHQFVSGINDDSISLFVDDILKSGQGRTDRRLAHVLSARSADAVSFLEEKLGRELSNVAILGGHSRPRTHRFPTPPGSKPMPIGFTVISALKNFLNDEKWKGKIEIMEHTNVTDLEIQHETLPSGSIQTRVHSIKIAPSSDAPTSDTQSLPSSLTPDAIVLSSGGFSADLGSNGLVSRFSQIAAKCPYTTNGPFATGDLLKVGQRLGFDTVDLDQIQLHPTSFVDPKNPSETQKFLCPEVVRGSGALLLDRNGQRFINELERRDVVSTAINQYGSTAQEWKLTDNNSANKNEADNKMAILLMNGNVRSKVGESTFDFYKARGFIRELGKREDAAAALEFNLDTFASTLDSYNDALNGKINDQFGKTTFPSEYSKDDILYSAFITPAVHYTMGGIKINPEAQVMQEHQPISNLFAAGEVAGGVHGANRLGGNGMLESVVFGRLAGSNAANLYLSKFLSDPFKSAQPLSMTISELSSLSHTKQSSDFSLLRLSFPSLRQTLPLPLGQPLKLLMRLRYPRQRCAAPGPMDFSTSAVPAASTSGHLDFIIPTFAVKELKELHPGDKVEIELSSNENGDPTSIMTSCDDTTAVIITHASSFNLNTVAQFAVHAKRNPKLQLKIVLLSPPSIDCTGLVNYIQNGSPNVDVQLIQSDAIQASPTIQDYIKSDQLPDLHSLLESSTSKFNQGVKSLQSCWAAQM